MLLALFIFSISVIWFLIEFSKVEFICNYDVTGADYSRSLAHPFCLLGFFGIFFSNLFFQIQPSGELDSVTMNIKGEANAAPVLTISLSTQACSSMEERLNLIHKFHSLSAVDLLSFSETVIELGCKVIGIRVVSFHMILHVILIIVQRELDAICCSSILLMSFEQIAETQRKSHGISALISFEKRRSFQKCKRQHDLKFHLVLLGLRASLTVPEIATKSCGNLGLSCSKTFSTNIQMCCSLTIPSLVLRIGNLPFPSNQVLTLTWLKGGDFSNGGHIHS